jgi:predicted amidohydrolase YtcJ
VLTRILVLALGASAAALPQTADLVLRDGKIVTMNAKAPVAEAIAIRGDRILAVGNAAQMRRVTGPATKTIDLHGRLAIPGFIEAHAHFTGIGAAAMSLNLREAKRWDDIVEQVERAAKNAKPGEWIQGRGWHQAKWTSPPSPNVEGFPVHASLSQVSPNNPVLLTHASGHASFVNEAAMKAAGIGRGTPNPSGGAIVKDAQGNPTGLLQERASGLVQSALNAWRARMTAAARAAEARKTVELASAECLAKGVTSFQDAGSGFSTVDLLRAMAEEGKLPLRLWVMLNVSNADLERNAAQYRVMGAANGHLTVRAIKRMIDGALGPRGAWLLAPYSDLPPGAKNPAGFNTQEPAEIRRTADIALRLGYQLCVHAIGDRANRETLDVFEQAFRAHPEKKDLRWRIEHAQHLSAADIPRLAALGVIPAMQGIHCTSDAPYVLQRLGRARAEEGAYVWRRLLDSGARIANGTDAPVEDVSPIASFHASVSRRLKDGSLFFPAQRMTREEALRSYTLDAAYAAFEEGEKGSLEAGKLADVVVLSRDIMTVPEDQILSTDVVYTIVGGKVVYENQVLAAR